MNCDRQQDPDCTDGKDHLDMHPLNLPLNLRSNAALVLNIGWCLPVVWWV
jgi:hypothetical protein